MRLKEAYNSLQKSKEFEEWFKKNNRCYLSHGFAMIEAKEKIEEYDEWQFGYYNEKTDKITNFFVSSNSVKISDELEILKQKHEKINRLNISSVHIDCIKADNICHNLLVQHYPKVIPFKKIFILQNLNFYNTIWNITIVDKNLNTLNIKIDALSGKIKDHSLKKLIQV